MLGDADLHDPGHRETSPGEISLPEILSALSFALDLTESAVPGHALRSCLLGMRIGQELRLGSEQLFSLYYALLLKDIGCSSNAARLCSIVGGDERVIKAGVKLVDWTKPHKPDPFMTRLLWRTTLPDANPIQRAAHMLRMALHQHRNNAELISLRCHRGADIIRKIGLSQEAADAVRSLDEHWDGSGYPEHRAGRQIPLLSSILAIAQHLDVFAIDRGPDIALRVLRQRSGAWFDPELVRIALALDKRGSLWTHCFSPEQVVRAAVLDHAPGAYNQLSAAHIDQICEAFADVVDAKSPFTFSHSLGVTAVAQSIAATLGYPPQRIRFIHRAALLHDIGKLRVPNSILDKPGAPTPAEWVVIKEHPVLTRQILLRVRAFQDLAHVAAAHHERLDGSGYPDALAAAQLNQSARIIAVADVYTALKEDRPYRAGLAEDRIRGIMATDIPQQLDPDCYQALLYALDHGAFAAAPLAMPRPENPASQETAVPGLDAAVSP